jgi:hypothetical protein
MSVPIGAQVYPTTYDMGLMAEDYSRYTVRELISTTSGVGLATLVATRAAMQLLTLIDDRRWTRTELVPPGGGTAHNFQKLIAATGTVGEVDPGTVTNAITNSTETLSNPSATIKQFAIRTGIDDLAQRQAAVNLAEVYGIYHGNAMNNMINIEIIVNGADQNSANKLTVGGSGDAKTTNYTWNMLFDGRGSLEAQRGRPDTFVTFPYSAASGTGGANVGFYPFVRDNVTAVAGGGTITYYGALANYLLTGEIAQVFGMRVFSDNTYTYTNQTGTQKNFTSAASKYAQILVSNEAVGYAQAEDVTAEIQRWSIAVAYQLVTHAFGGAALVLDQHTLDIEHA